MILTLKKGEKTHGVRTWASLSTHIDFFIKPVTMLNSQITLKVGIYWEQKSGV